jgi:hypothetical protein
VERNLARGEAKMEKVKREEQMMGPGLANRWKWKEEK